jgi:hypothetical protein
MKKKNMKSFLDFVDVSTRGKRRKAIWLTIELLEKIRHAEERYMQRIPLNLRSGTAYFEADYSVDTIIDAIIELMRAYDH